MKRRLLLVQIYSNWTRKRYYRQLVGIKYAGNIFTWMEKFEGQKLEIFGTARYYVVPKIKYYEYRRKKIHAFEFVEKQKEKLEKYWSGVEDSNHLQPANNREQFRREGSVATSKIDDDRTRSRKTVQRKKQISRNVDHVKNIYRAGGKKG